MNSKADRIDFLDGLNLEEVKLSDKEIEKEKIKQLKKEQKEGGSKVETKIIESVMKKVENEEPASENIDSTDLTAKQKLLLHLNAYSADEVVHSYLQKLGIDITGKRIKDLSVRELENLLETVKKSLRFKNTGNFWRDFSFGSLWAFESLITMSRLKQRFRIQGFYEDLKSDESLDFQLRGYFLEDPRYISVSPSLQILGRVGSALVKRHMLNTSAFELQKVLENVGRKEDVKEFEKEVEKELPLNPPPLVRQTASESLLESMQTKTGDLDSIVEMDSSEDDA